MSSGTENKKAYNNGLINKYFSKEEIIPEGFVEGFKPRSKEDRDRSNLKRKATCREKYGVDNINQLPQVRDKIKETTLNKYGCEHYFQTEEFIKYNKDIQEERYGGVGMASEVTKNKIIESNLINYGCKCYFQTPEFITYNKNLQISKYGGVGFASNELRDKSIKTCMSNHDLSSIEEYNSYVAKRTQESMIDKYGVNTFAKLPEFHKKSKHLYLYDDNNFDSQPELALYIYARDNNESISRNYTTYYTYTYNDKEHYYFPDFIYNGRLIEIKGDHFFKNDGTMCNPFDHTQDALYEAKHQCMKKNLVYIMKSLEYNKYIVYCEKKFNSKI